MKNITAINAKAIVLGNGKVVLPKILREKLGIQAGSELLFEIHTDGIIVIKILKRSIEMFFGRCKRKNKKSISIRGMDRAIMRGISK